MEDFSDARQTRGGVMVAVSIAVEKEEEDTLDPVQKVSVA